MCKIYGYDCVRSKSPCIKSSIVVAVFGVYFVCLRKVKGAVLSYHYLSKSAFYNMSVIAQRLLGWIVPHVKVR